MSSNLQSNNQGCNLLYVQYELIYLCLSSVQYMEHIVSSLKLPETKLFFFFSFPICVFACVGVQ